MQVFRLDSLCCVSHLLKYHISLYIVIEVFGRENFSRFNFVYELISEIKFPNINFLLPL